MMSGSYRLTSYRPTACVGGLSRLVISAEGAASIYEDVYVTTRTHIGRGHCSVAGDCDNAGGI